MLRGTLKGHSNWVTAIATTPEDNNMILSASRGACSSLTVLFKVEPKPAKLTVFIYIVFFPRIPTSMCDPTTAKSPLSYSVSPVMANQI